MIEYGQIMSAPGKIDNYITIAKREDGRLVLTGAANGHFLVEAIALLVETMNANFMKEGAKLCVITVFRG